MDDLGQMMDGLGAAMDEASKQACADLRRLAEDAVRRGGDGAAAVTVGRILAGAADLPR